MKKKHSHSKQNIHKSKEQRKSVKAVCSPFKSSDHFFKQKQARHSIGSNIKSLLKPKKDNSSNERNSFNLMSHSMSTTDAMRGSLTKGRFFTETMPCKSTQKDNLLVKKVGAVVKRNKNGQTSTASFGKERFSFNQTFGQDKSKNSPENQSSTSNHLKKLMKERKAIQLQVKKSLQKPNIQKKELLRITDQYERLIDHFMISAEQNTFEDTCVKDLAEELELERTESTCTVCRHEEAECSGGSGEKKMMLKLEDLRKLGIMDYDDQFMSHYDELSESWKRDLKEQKRF